MITVGDDNAASAIIILRCNASRTDLLAAEARLQRLHDGAERSAPALKRPDHAC